MAAVDFFLKIEGIDGESLDSQHPNEIEISSFSWGVTNTGSWQTGGAGNGRVAEQDFHFTTHTSKASPKLFEACCTGKHIDKAVLSVRKAGTVPFEYLHIQFEDILISGFATGGQGLAVPTDQFSLNFSKIEWEYVVQKTGELDEVTIDFTQLQVT